MLHYRFIQVLSLSALLVVFVGGCATETSRTVTTERVQYTDGRPSAPLVEKSTTETTTKTEDTKAETGVLSGTVNVVGEVLALPFRAVGGLVRGIF
jgi:hypothetical protein